MNKPSVLPPGLKLVGDVEGDDDFVVLGAIDGDVHVGGHLLIEEGGVVRGHVDARAVTVRGSVLGDATAKDSIRIDATGRMAGDVHAPRVQVIEGAMVRGRVQMTDAPAPPVVHRDRRVRTPRPERAERAERSASRSSPGVLPAPRVAPSADGSPTAVDLEAAVTTPAPRKPEPAPAVSARPGPPPPRFPVLRRATARRKS